ncbi:glycosyltransferase family 4 protein [Vagococcus zengguangii]|uniref:glycosyltransferase family 4 protein n=1 Tax=Vagococcus zengguangii TaxID=2571750 RepID=UPI00110890BD|nr:glycosyltransferase family 4 protein [Vagococcus zengguangii]TLG80942.1 glycosyltransferase family 4 protein [Vagococcus zengguangii]
MSKKILLVSQYFFPENFRVNDLAAEWHDRGYDVTILTGIPNYPEGKYYDGYCFFSAGKENFKGMKVVRLPLIPRGKSSIMLALNYFSFVFFGGIWSLFSRGKYDRVFVYEVSPITQALPAVWFSKRKKIPCDIYVLDLWPENFEVMTGISNKKIIGILNRMVKYIYKNMTNIFVSSPDFKISILQKDVPAEKIKYWPQYAESFYEPVNINQLNNKEKYNIKNNDGLSITYAGNIGEAQALTTLPQVALLLKNNSQKVCFNIIGDGRDKENLIKKINELDVNDYFNFIEKQPAEEIKNYLALSDVAFISLSDNPIFSLTIPAKMQSIMACGRPILANSNGVVQTLIDEAECGFYADSGEVEQLYLAIEKFISTDKSELVRMGKNAEVYYKNKFEKKSLLDEMDTYLEV